MKKLILAACLIISISATAQKKDTVKQDTVYVFTISDVKQLKSILMESKLTINGQVPTGNDLIVLLNWIESKQKIFTKEQPK